jgi:hypothetical protein
MTKTSLSAFALAALVAGAAVAGPALADPYNGQKLFDSNWYLTQLRYEGINATAADDVNGDTFRATIVQDGHTVFEFFNKDSLQVVKQ